MSIKDTIRARGERVVEVATDLEELPVVRVRRLKTSDVLEMALRGDNEGGLLLVQRAIVDDDDQPVFADTESVAAADWELVQALIGAAQSVNAMKGKTDEAGKD